MDDGRDHRLVLYSHHLFNILDFIGLSDYMRRTVQHSSTVQELLMSATQNITDDREIPSYTYRFGSSIEGTTTPGMESDIDCLICAEYPPVVEKMADASAKICNLMISDELTPPGYTKLQRVFDKQPRDEFEVDEELETLDTQGKPVLRNKVLIESMTNDEINGPAGTTLQSSEYPGVPDQDFVPAFRCATWPSQASAWLFRHRKYDFPSEETIQRFLKYGCFLVSVGHPKSQEKDLQWRLSFSVQEREIMFNLNPTQHKCYVLLKMIKNNFIKPAVSGKSLTSYHCKTCIFYMLEQNPEDIWKPENLILCLTWCLNTILGWLKDGFIPNYFIPEENMWKAGDKSGEQVIDILVTLLNNTPDFLLDIQTDSVGLFLKYAVLDLGELEDDTRPHDQVSETNEDKQKPEQPDEGQTVGEEEEKCMGYDFKPIDSDDDDDIVNDIVKSMMAKGYDGEEYNEAELQLAIQNELMHAILELNPDSQSQQEARDVPGIHLEVGHPGGDLIESFTKKCATVKALAEENLSDENYPHNKGTLEIAKKRVTSTASGTLLKLNLCSSVKEPLEAHQMELDRFIYKIHSWTVDYIISLAHELLLFAADEHTDTCIRLHDIIISRLKLESDERITSEHVGLDRRMAAGYILPFLYTSLGSQMAAKSLHTMESDDKSRIKMECLEYMDKGQESDAMSGRLKQAAVLLQLGELTKAKHLLDSVDERFVPTVAYMCCCSKKKDVVIESLRNKIRNEKLSTFEILHDHIGVCVWFLPTELCLVPKELQYEMFRSVFSQAPRKQYIDDWFDLAVVDPTVFLYFMLYRVQQKLGNTEAMNLSLAYMVATMESTLNLSHLETANNILGCILKEKGHIDYAWRCFMASWIIRPDHNAAKWHMAIMVYEVIQSRDREEGVEVIYRRK